MRVVPVLRAMRAGLTRRRVQTVVIAVVLLVSTGASVLGLALAADSNAPFDHAFAAQRGADVSATVDPAVATPAELAATRRLPQVTAAAGPFPQATDTLQLGGQSGCTPAPGSPCVGAQTLPGVTLVGRATPGGPVDDVILQSGHWAERPGQLVLSSAEVYPNGSLPPGTGVGTELTAAGVAGTPTLTVVGIGTSVTGSADGWVAPAEIARLRPPKARRSAQMLYRFRSAGSAAAVRAGVAAVTAALPRGAVPATQSYLTAREAEASGIAPVAPFLVAFGLTGLVMSALIVINVVAGAVVAGYRRIGILKSIGFTPGQVVTAYAVQALVPTAAGCAAGLVIGNLLAAPLLGSAASVYGVGSLGVPAWVDAAVAGAMCCMVGLAAVASALRAGRLSATAAIAAGRAPRSGRGYIAHRLLGRLRLPRPVTIGLAAPFARPSRAAFMLVVVLLGTSAVIGTVGLGGSLTRVVYGLSLAGAEQVRVSYLGGSPSRLPAPGGGHGPGVGPGAGASGPPVGQPMDAGARRVVAAALSAQPGTLHYVAEADEQATVSGVAGPIPVTAYLGSAGWTGYGMISGRWYSGPGQVDVPAYFLAVTGKAVGDTVTMTFAGRQIPVRIAGEIFDNQNNGLAMVTDWQTLASADAGMTAGRYDVGLRPGTSPTAYVRQVQAALGQGYVAGVNSNNKGLPLVLGLIGSLALLLAIAAGLGVLAAVVLQTRERAYQLGVFRAVGMTPRQTIAMVVCSVAGIGLAAGVIAIPAGIAMVRSLVPVMGAAAGTGMPPSYLDVYSAGELAGLALAGVVIAVAGALLPATWAARGTTSSVLRAE
ncbi:MAG TPA: FtsX-like permease family protein [Streptosporangiaceae bacterium]|nr:FtsX-like permease family protein [Streptosporangiaceae bacterium]